jgi:hypothetical protein
MKPTIINDEFLSEYLSLPKFIRSFVEEIEWRITNQKIIELIDNSKIDFIWYSLNFNLFAKTMFSHYPQLYTYINDFLCWKFGNHRTLGFINKDKFLLLIDKNIQSLPFDYQNKFVSHSIKNMDKYVNHFIELIKYFENEIPEIKAEDILKEVINEYYFKVEFSEVETDLSKKYLNKLRNYATN